MTTRQGAPNGDDRSQVVRRAGLQRLRSRRLRVGLHAVDGQRLRAGRPDGCVSRTGLHLAGADPRVAWRSPGSVTDSELAEVQRQLARLDAASHHGSWTMAVLRLIRDRPAVRAGDLAPAMGQDTQP